MNLDDVKKLIRMFRDGDLSELDWEEEDFRVSLRRNEPPQVVAPAAPPSVVMAPAAAPAPAPAPEAPSAAPPAEAEPDTGAAITSPMVGTFYGAPTPEAPPYVSVGTAVTEDTVVCIVEAMKVMNEIKAEKSGTICEVVAEDGRPVQFGDVLFRIK